MAEKKNIVTPVRPAKWIWLKTPKTQFNPDGEYTVTLVFDDPNDEFLGKIEKKAQFEFNKTKENLKPAQAKTLKYVSPIKKETDSEGNETGNLMLSFKSKAIIRKKDGSVINIKIRLFDAQGEQIKSFPNIGNGSKLSVAFNPVGAVVSGKFFLSLWINGVQLIDLVEYSADGSSLGFGSHDGYSHSNSEDTPDDDPFTSNSTGSEESGDVDF